MTSVFSGDLLGCFIRILNQKVSTFEQLAKVNSSIYISTSLRVSGRSLVQFRPAMEKYRDTDDIQVLSMEQLNRPMKLFCCLWGLSVILFIIEIIIVKFKNWYERRNRH